MTLPRTAAWQHRDARDGFEVVFFEPGEDGLRIAGYTTAVEAGDAWAVDYVIALDADWLTRSARVRVRSARGAGEVRLESDGAGHWRIDGAPAPELDGCPDVDLEASAFTNALPVHRLGLDVGQAADAPAAYVRALDLGVQRLEQRYVRVDDRRYDYAAPAFEFEARLVYDEHGLVREYPGLAARVA